MGTWAKWEVSDRAWSISTSQFGDVLVTSRSSRLLLEYAPGGCLRLKIKLPSSVLNPNHSMRVNADLLVLCHGDMTDQTQRVCTVNNNGDVLKWYKVGYRKCILFSCGPWSFFYLGHVKKSLFNTKYNTTVGRKLWCYTWLLQVFWFHISLQSEYLVKKIREIYVAVQYCSIVCTGTLPLVWSDFLFFFC